MAQENSANAQVHWQLGQTSSCFAAHLDLLVRPQRMYSKRHMTPSHCQRYESYVIFLVYNGILKYYEDVAVWYGPFRRANERAVALPPTLT
jgi:hypothetical protein